MSTFQYKAVDSKTGLIVKNTVKAESKQELYNKLKENGLTPINIEPAFQFVLQKKEDEEEIEQKIKRQVRPGINQIIGILVLFILGTISIIPTIQSLFNQMNNELELPWITRKINDISGILEIVIIGIIVAIIGLIIYFKTENGKKNWKVLRYKIPILGKILYEIDELEMKDSEETNIENEIQKINKKISKIVNILIAIIIIFFVIIVVMPSIQIYIQALTIVK